MDHLLKRSVCRGNVVRYLQFPVRFDIYKPSIIGRIDKNVKGGWGVMGDDLAAGFVAGVCSIITYHLLSMYVF